MRRTRPVKRINDIFISGNYSEPTLYWVGLFVIMSALFFVGFLELPLIKSWGLIYLLLCFFCFSMMTPAVVTKNKIGGIVVYGKTNTRLKFVRDIGVGILIGLFLIGGYLGFSIAFNPAPFSLSGVGGAGALSSLVILLIVGFFGVEVEEMFRASTLIPSILKLTGGENLVAALLSAIIMFVLIVLFVILQIAGSIALWIALGFIGIGVFIGLKEHIKKTTRPSPAINHAIAILVGATIFMTLHIYAYGGGSFTTNISAYISVFIFAVVADTTNWMLQSTLASRMIHSVNNLTIVTVILGLSWHYAVAILLIYVGILFINAFTFNKSIAAYDLRNRAFQLQR